MRFYQLWQRIFKEAIEEHNPAIIGQNDGYYEKIKSITTTLTPMQCIEFALYCANDVIHLIENNPYLINARKCMELANQWLKDSNSVSKEQLKSAADNTYLLSLTTTNSSNIDYAYYDMYICIAVASAAATIESVISDSISYIAYSAKAAANAMAASSSVARLQKQQEYLEIARSFKLREMKPQELHRKIGGMASDIGINMALDYIEEKDLWEELGLITNNEGQWYIPYYELFPETFADTKEELVTRIMTSQSPLFERIRNYIKQIYQDYSKQIKQSEYTKDIKHEGNFIQYGKLLENLKHKTINPTGMDFSNINTRNYSDINVMIDYIKEYGSDQPYNVGILLKKIAHVFDLFYKQYQNNFIYYVSYDIKAIYNQILDLGRILIQYNDDTYRAKASYCDSLDATIKLLNTLNTISQNKLKKSYGKFRKVYEKLIDFCTLVIRVLQEIQIEIVDNWEPIGKMSKMRWTPEATANEEVIVYDSQFDIPEIRGKLIYGGNKWGQDIWIARYENGKQEQLTGVVHGDHYRLRWNRVKNVWEFK